MAVRRIVHIGRKWLLAAGSLALCTSRVTAQDNSIQAGLAAQYFNQLNQTSERDGGKMWGGPLYGPIMFMEPATHKIVANQADAGGKLTQQGDVYAGTLPNEISPANTAIWWSGVHWTMVMWPVPEFRQPRERLLLHECFHRLQDDLRLRARDVVNSHLDELDGRIWIQLEWRALERALRETDAARKDAINDALLFRAYRRTLYPNAAMKENALELNEGLAEYTGVRLSSADPEETVMRSDLILRQARNYTTFSRSFAYVSGPAYGALLDQAGQPWRMGLDTTSDLGVLLADRYGIRVQPSETAARDAASRYEGDEIIGVETRDEQQRRQKIADAKKKYLEGPTLAVQLSPDVKYSYDPSDVFGIDSATTVYPTLRLVDAWGILTVTQGAWLVRGPKGQPVSARVIAPLNYSQRPLKGEGWSLELKDGWKVAAGVRAGDFIVQKGP